MCVLLQCCVFSFGLLRSEIECLCVFNVSVTRARVCEGCLALAQADTNSKTGRVCAFYFRSRMVQDEQSSVCALQSGFEVLNTPKCKPHASDQ